MRSFYTPGRSDVNSYRQAHASPPSDRVDLCSMEGDKPKVHPIPAGATVVLFTATGDFFVKFGSAATLTLSGDVADGTAPELNPSARTIPEGETSLTLIAPSYCYVSMSFYG